ncbi:NEQ219 [Nanoarchaeum equitans Kin4-M]|uniref:Small ribosomal subunit protein eS27 n=1 Tax=Nanoarchaeum equitans (strain Kin4-M) TaxID=228908 RepID=Q74MQ7_NANEQ|nr:NEQ219 [Nanoarchaeum equitans Kin4-M]
MVKQVNDYIVKPRSRFIKVRCKCGNEQIIFDRASTIVKCHKCGNILAKPTGGKAQIFGEIVEIYE